MADHPAASTARRNGGRVLIFMPGHRRDPLTRIYEPLLLSLTRWLTLQSLPHKFVEVGWFKHCVFSAHDVAVFVGVDSFLKPPRGGISEHGLSHNTSTVCGCLRTQAAKKHFKERSRARRPDSFTYWPKNNYTYTVDTVRVFQRCDFTLPDSYPESACIVCMYSE